MTGYYSRNLAAERLRSCYEFAPPRVRQYLEAEIEFVLDLIGPDDVVLELGCGYGRVLERLADQADRVVGIDTSPDSLRLAGETLKDAANVELVQMDAVDMDFRDDTFDLVICIQNGISAFHVDQHKLIEEAVRVIRPGGTALFSSYSPRFWEHRLEWFRIQAEHDLIGEIDEEATGEGVIRCKDGFEATTVSREEFLFMTSAMGLPCEIIEVDQSSIFCTIRV